MLIAPAVMLMAPLPWKPEIASKLGLFYKEKAKTGKVEVDKSVSDQELRKIIKQVIEKNKDALQKHNPIGILMGEVMKEVKGRADGKKIAEILKEEIK